MRLLKEMIDQFISEGVLVSDSSCDFASPLVIVNKKDVGIRMAVDYREVYMKLEPLRPITYIPNTSLPYHPKKVGIYTSSRISRSFWQNRLNWS